MSRQEKLAILRVRASSLRERALVVERAFANEFMKRRAIVIRMAIEEELERLQKASGDPLPSLKRFLPGPAATLENLETILRREGANATPNSLAPLLSDVQDGSTARGDDDRAKRR